MSNSGEVVTELEVSKAEGKTEAVSNNEAEVIFEVGNNETQ